MWGKPFKVKRDWKPFAFLSPNHYSGCFSLSWCCWMPYITAINHATSVTKLWTGGQMGLCYQDLDKIEVYSSVRSLKMHWGNWPQNKVNTVLIIYWETLARITILWMVKDKTGIETLSNDEIIVCMKSLVYWKIIACISSFIVTSFSKLFDFIVGLLWISSANWYCDQKRVQSSWPQ